MTDKDKRFWMYGFAVVTRMNRTAMLKQADSRSTYVTTLKTFYKFHDYISASATTNPSVSCVIFLWVQDGIDRHSILLKKTST